MDATVPAVINAEVPAILSTYKFLQAKDAAAIVRENLGSEGLNPYDLDRVKFPSGGSPAWAVPSLSGDLEPVKSIEGIIIYWRQVRSYWANAYTGENVPPECSSNDGITGKGIPGGSCAMCPLGQFGSDPNGSGGQACKLSRLLFIMTKDNIIPLAVSLPPTSVKPLKQYFLRLAGQQVPYYGCITSLGLETMRSGSGIAYSVVKPKMVGDPLPPEMMAYVQAFAKTIESSLNQVTLEQGDLHNGAVDKAA